jgi:hypothetical protein
MERNVLGRIISCGPALEVFGVLSLRLFGWRFLSLGAGVPTNPARRIKCLTCSGRLQRCGGGWAHDGEVAGRRRRRFLFSDFRFEAAAATLSGTGSASRRPDRDSWL